MIDINSEYKTVAEQIFSEDTLQKIREGDQELVDVYESINDCFQAKSRPISGLNIRPNINFKDVSSTKNYNIQRRNSVK